MNLNHTHIRYSYPPHTTTNTQPPAALFDDSFWFGLATAPGHAEDHLDDAWLKFAKRGHVPAWNNTPRADERLHFWSEPDDEIALAAKTGASVYRLGIDWGRLVPHCTLDEPEPCGVQNLSALGQYEHILRRVRAHNMSSMLSLFHHSFPQWGMDWSQPESPTGAASGQLWQHPRAVAHFVAFSRDVIERLAPLVDFWVTFNEPVVFSILTHCVGLWPPGPRVDNPVARLNCMTNPKVGALLSQANMVLAHRRIYALVRQNERQRALPFAPVGVAHLLMDSRAYSFGLDEGSSLFIDVYARYLFVDLVKDAIDFCGVNYYGVEVVSGTGAALKPSEVEYSGSGRGIEPAGLYNLLQQFHERYAEDPRARFLGAHGYGFVITENGIADATDTLRPAYMIEHLMAVAAARRRGIKVRGYVHWTTSDNWEWADGYCPRFGLCAVDRSTPALTRTCRESYHLYAEIIRTHRVTHEQRAWAWERVTSATAAGATHEICRSSDAVNALEEPQQWPLLGGSMRKDGTTVDWRFNESKTHPPGDKDDAAAATDMISSAMRMSATTGLDPLAGFINGVAELSHALRIPPPPAPPVPTPGVAAPTIEDYFDIFRKSFIDAVEGDEDGESPVEVASDPKAAHDEAHEAASLRTTHPAVAAASPRGVEQAAVGVLAAGACALAVTAVKWGRGMRAPLL